MRLAFHRAQMNKVFASSALAYFTFAAAVTAEVEQPITASVTREVGSNFACGAKEFQNVTGAFFFSIPPRTTGRRSIWRWTACALASC